jgi:hypothetical protein
VFTSVALAGLLLAGAAGAQDLLAEKRAYLTLLERYASGDVEGAAAGVLDADPVRTRDVLRGIVADIEVQLARLRQLSADTRGEAPVEARRNDLRRQRLRVLKLSLLLHTDAAIRVRVPHDHLHLASGTAAHRLTLLRDDYRRFGPTRDGVPPAERTAAAEAEWADVDALVRDWYLTVISHLFKVRQWDLVRAFIPAALKSFEDDAELLLARGSYWEYDAMTMLVDRSLAREIYAGRVLTLAQQRAGWAADDFERALRQRGDLHEARLRLGHARALLGKRNDAAKALGAVISSEAPVYLRYMAHVFAGDLADEAGEAAAARTHYEAALALYPSAQRPKLSLSLSCLSAGDRACADEWLERSTSEVSPDRNDPWWTYADGPGRFAESRLAALRARGLRP